MNMIVLKIFMLSTAAGVFFSLIFSTIILIIQSIHDFIKEKKK